MLVKTIITHTRPHIDEIAAIWLLRKFGKGQYPGVNEANIVFWPNGGATPDGRPASAWENEGYLLIGTGGGRFDEHRTATSNGNRDECAATLVAKNLGLLDDAIISEVLSKILNFITNYDLKGTKHPFDLASIVEDLNAQFPNDPYKVIDWAIMGLEAKYLELSHFFEEAKNEFAAKAQIFDIIIHGRSRKLVVIVSDSEQASKFARSKFGCEAAIVITKNSKGNVAIHTNQKEGLIKINDLARVIRYEEQKIKGRIITSDWNELGSEGKIEGVDEWYFLENGQMLLNGSPTATGVPATAIALEKIVEYTKIAVDNQTFPTNCPKDKCLKNKCPWYNWGLGRCKSIRYKQHNQ